MITPACSSLNFKWFCYFKYFFYHLNEIWGGRGVSQAFNLTSRAGDPLVVLNQTSSELVSFHSQHSHSSSSCPVFFRKFHPCNTYNFISQIQPQTSWAHTTVGNKCTWQNITSIVNPTNLSILKTQVRPLMGLLHGRIGFCSFIGETLSCI